MGLTLDCIASPDSQIYLLIDAIHTAAMLHHQRVQRRAAPPNCVIVPKETFAFFYLIDFGVAIFRSTLSHSALAQKLTIEVIAVGERETAVV